ncbi:hypothetical protein IWX47DRAFT_245210 [Phyllosticta citricarpa]|uniref:Uncharacterized protein n=1 Tax=Phyllosticta citricarpa TaxID=55181 RepID=A0ABR1MHW2_9PEZI
MIAFNSGSIQTASICTRSSSRSQRIWTRHNPRRRRSRLAALLQVAWRGVAWPSTNRHSLRPRLQVNGAALRPLRLLCISCRRIQCTAGLLRVIGHASRIFPIHIGTGKRPDLRLPSTPFCPRVWAVLRSDWLAGTQTNKRADSCTTVHVVTVPRCSTRTTDRMHLETSCRHHHLPLCSSPAGCPTESNRSQI